MSDANIFESSDRIDLTEKVDEDSEHTITAKSQVDGTARHFALLHEKQTGPGLGILETSDPSVVAEIRDQANVWLDQHPDHDNSSTKEKEPIYVRVLSFLFK